MASTTLDPADTTTTLTDLPLVLYLPDFAPLLRCSRRTVERLDREKRLPDPLPLPGRRRWSRDVVLTWLQGGNVSRRRR
jgi:hypothetical protein